jgi:carbon storage regulator CsrA
MLILSRKCGESLVIEGEEGPIVVRVQRVGRGKVSLAIEAPRAVVVRRGEVMGDVGGWLPDRRPMLASGGERV